MASLLRPGCEEWTSAEHDRMSVPTNSTRNGATRGPPARARRSVRPHQTARALTSYWTQKGVWAAAIHRIPSAARNREYPIVALACLQCPAGAIASRSLLTILAVGDPLYHGGCAK